MNSRVYFLKPLLVFLFSSFIFACGIDDAGTPSNTQTQTPLISVHPQSADRNQGSTATLSVTARGRSLTYQWYSNTTNSNNGGVPISGATSLIYTLPTGTLGTFYYYVVVTDTYSAASAISNVAVINVTPTQAIPIYNAADLYNIRHNLSANYRLMNDISLSDYSTGSGWEPIGSCAVNADVPFSGSLDGDGYKITDLYVNTVGAAAGLFGCLTGRVDNLGVEIAAGGVTASYSSSSSYAGGIAGYVKGGAITGSYTTGYLSSTTSATSASTIRRSSYAGGIAGYVDNGTISGSYSTGQVSAASTSFSYSFAGGIAGYVNGGVISGSNSTGYVSASSTSTSANSSAYYPSYAGGIAGYVSGTVSGSYSTGDISSYTSYPTSSPYSSFAGGITGYISGTVSGSYSTGDISSSSTTYAYVGGISGYVSGMISGSYSTGDITSISSSNYPSYAGGIAGYVKGIINICYSTGDISSNYYAGGIAGYIDGVAIMGCYATGNISARYYAGGIAGYARNTSITGCAAANGYIESTAGGTTYTGRVAGSINSSPATNNFANLDMLLNSAKVSDSTGNGTGKTLAELQTKDAYESAVNGDGLGGLGWEFGNSGGTPVWKMPEGGTGYPILIRRSYD